MLVCQRMHRPLGRVSFCSIAEKFKSHKQGQRNVTDEFWFSQNFTALIGNNVSKHCPESTTDSILKQIVSALHMGERSRASALLLELGQEKKSLKPHNFVPILQYCARSPDPLLVLETWQIMEEKKVGLDSKCYLLMIRALCKGGYLEEASNMIDFIGERHGIYPTLPVYNTFLGACSDTSRADYADQCLQLMERRMMGKDEVTYIMLLKLAVSQQNLSAVYEIWKDYIKHFSPSILTLQKFIWSFTRLRDLKSAYEKLQHMVVLAIRGNTFVQTSSRGQLYPSRLNIPIHPNYELGLQKFDLKDNEQSVPLSANAPACNIQECDNEQSVPSTANAPACNVQECDNEQSVPSTANAPACNIQECVTLDMGNKEVESAGQVGLDKHKIMPFSRILRWSFNDVIHACAQAKKPGLAKQLMLQMENIGLLPSSHTYNGFARAVSKRHFRKGMEVLKTMQQKNLKPCDPTLATISVACSKALELDLAEVLLDQITNCPYPYPYNSFLEACDAMDQPERAVRMLAKMKKLKIQPDIRTYQQLFSLVGNTNAPYEDGDMLSRVDSAKRIKAIEKDMAKNGVQHSRESMKNLLKALGKEGMMRELMQYLCVAEDLFYHSNTHLGIPIYNTVLHSLVEAEECRMAIALFKHMKASGFEPNAATYCIMIDCCRTIRCYKSACALVSMMLRSGFYLQTVGYTALIKILLQDENFDEALNLLDQGHSEEIKLDVLLYNPVLHVAKDKGRIDIIELIVEQMHREKIQPDTTTCHNVFSAYVYCGFHNMAMEALQVLSMRMISQEDCVLEEKKAGLEDLILSEDKEAESRILEHFKDFEENIAVALLNLRNCAILGFPISWSPNKSAWARRLSANYDSRKKVH
ncbi:pentatricopeptide repeat-containing protein At1g76280 isoform X3 [Populus nigra]|uniref:pentatricopeptide repeat-containing protein At1g76280 isoform X3 n=1 Tax=Populus nigra TaxID=3691 RepID=UPI002B275A38|nr:pentatricopeptide repeat-containing protein At1g76280 isoform X3 [Populus nigra]